MAPYLNSTFLGKDRKMAEEEVKKHEPKGLECLDDQTLAHIVEASLRDGDELKDEALTAFRILEMRTP